MNNAAFYIIGGGRVGATFCFQLLNRGMPVLSVVESDRSRTRFLEETFHWNLLEPQVDNIKLDQAEFIILAVRDDQIQTVAKDLAERPVQWKQKYIFHCSGTLPAETLNSLYKKGADIAALHPVCSFASDPRENLSLNKIWFSFEGSRSFQKKLENILENTGRIFKVSSTDKVNIHLACVFVSNFTVALAALGGKILEETGISPASALEILTPLMRSTLTQISSSGTAGALTGPLKRADVGTIKKHLDILHDNPQNMRELYISLSRELFQIAKLSPEDQKMLNDVFQLARTKT